MKWQLRIVGETPLTQRIPAPRSELIPTPPDAFPPVIRKPSRIADAVVPAVKCLRPYWRAMAKAVLRLLHDEREASEPTAEGAEGQRVEAAPPPLLLRSALGLVRQDLEILRGRAAQGCP